MKRYFAPAGWALGMLVLILDGKTAMAGASEGLQLCVQTLIPSLFPFFVLSAMLTSSLPGGGLLLAGILGGYPVGAGNVARAFQAGQLTREEAERMVVLCNCAGPSFIFGVLGPVLGGAGQTVIVWLAYLVSVFALWLLLPKTGSSYCPSRSMGLQQALTQSIRSMAGVCGWVILFRVVLTVLDRWLLWLLPDWGRTVLYGILELSGGCLALGNMGPGIGTILAAGFVAFGGICILLQTASVATGISLKYYVPGKLFQSLVSMLAASFLCPGVMDPGIQAVFLVAAAGIGLGFRKNEKRCGNRRRIIV